MAGGLTPLLSALAAFAALARAPRGTRLGAAFLAAFGTRAAPTTAPFSLFGSNWFGAATRGRARGRG
eukprot:3897777-Lingulodinium_polyedra.AAC.1